MASRVAAAELQSLRYAEDVRRLYRQLQRAICQSLLGLANALEAKDPYTRGHSERVGARARRLASALGLPPDEIDTVTQAGLLHDIGKIGVPETVLRKRGALDHAEWALMRNHPLIGAQIVAPFDFFAGGALVIRHHHERWDGSGYPDGLVGAAIPLGARIVAVADVFDALTSDRPYRPALARDAALAYLTEEAGRTLDPDVVAVILGLVRVGELG
jgi:HD-GYP domain-containing protein (c-di-GMP phosphodiesterase class II)